MIQVNDLAYFELKNCMCWGISISNVNPNIFCIIHEPPPRWDYVICDIMISNWTIKPSFKGKSFAAIVNSIDFIIRNGKVVKDERN